MSELGKTEYTLYSSPFSLYSMMARHTVQLGPLTHDARPPGKITLSFVNHKENENLKEDYLVQVNPKGQVPAMTGNVLRQPLRDSISISIYLAEKHYPAMLPAEHAPVIRNLLERMHAIYGLSFSNRNPTAEMMQHNPSPMEDILKRTDISPKYRAALNYKLAFHNKSNGIAFQPSIVAKARTDLQTIFGEIVEHRRQSGAFGDEAEWTFGTRIGPTALDSHLLPLVLRCIEAGNTELVPDELQRWAETMAKSPAWEKVMHGRPTRWDPSMGPVADMKDMMSL
ncbi:putative GST N-terminal domain-containing protein [Seiridium unicorne]|uniref:GST N-terminal domain-containing protein n=1 Tax=Seiridium unicorne TaxID=138068 RepID=A0ABR2UK18_9PEZI